VHLQKRGRFWPATATARGNVEPKAFLLASGGDRFPAWRQNKNDLNYQGGA
jgi:hypothetical protein